MNEQQLKLFAALQATYRLTLYCKPGLNWEQPTVIRGIRVSRGTGNHMIVPKEYLLQMINLSRSESLRPTTSEESRRVWCTFEARNLQLPEQPESAKEPWTEVFSLVTNSEDQYYDAADAILVELFNIEDPWVIIDPGMI